MVVTGEDSVRDAAELDCETACENAWTLRAAGGDLPNHSSSTPDPAFYTHTRMLKWPIRKAEVPTLLIFTGIRPLLIFTLSSVAHLHCVNIRLRNLAVAENIATLSAGWSPSCGVGTKLLSLVVCTTANHKEGNGDKVTEELRHLCRESDEKVLIRLVAVCPAS